MDMKSNYRVIDETDNEIYLVDNDIEGYRSVTNDANNICNVYPDKRIFYCDSMGNWDEMIHDEGAFKTFSPIKDKLYLDKISKLINKRIKKGRSL